METIKGKRARKPNFSSAECTLLLTLAEENLDTIREKFSSSLTNQKKQQLWKNISDKISAIGVAKRTPADVREKWRAMRNEARKELCIEKKSLGRTGGGKPPAPPKERSQRIMAIFGDEPGFSGIMGGLESGRCPLSHLQKYLIILLKQ